MDLMTAAFVFALFVAAAFLTLVIRRDFIARQRLRREPDLQRQLEPPHTRHRRR